MHPMYCMDTLAETTQCSSMPAMLPILVSLVQYELTSTNELKATYLILLASLATTLQVCF